MWRYGDPVGHDMMLAQVKQVLLGRESHQGHVNRRPGKVEGLGDPLADPGVQGFGTRAQIDPFDPGRGVDVRQERLARRRQIDPQSELIDVGDRASIGLREALFIQRTAQADGVRDIVVRQLREQTVVHPHQRLTPRQREKVRAGQGLVRHLPTQLERCRGPGFHRAPMDEGSFQNFSADAPRHDVKGVQEHSRFPPASRFSRTASRLSKINFSNCHFVCSGEHREHRRTGQGPHRN